MIASKKSEKALPGLFHLRRLWRCLERDLIAAGDAPIVPGPDPWVLAIGLAAALSALVVWAGFGYHAGFLAFNRWSGQLPAIFWQALSFLGDEHLVFGVALVLARRHPRLVWALFWSALVGVALSHLGKHGFATLRPPAVLAPDSFRLLTFRVNELGFPSGHTQLAFTVTGTALYFIRGIPLRVVALGLAALIGLSRVAVGVHWPIDVLGGVAVGALAAWAGVRIARRIPWGLTPFGHLPVVATLFWFPLQMATGDHHGGLYIMAPLAALSGMALVAKGLQDYLLPACTMGREPGSADW